MQLRSKPARLNVLALTMKTQRIAVYFVPQTWLTLTPLSGSQFYANVMTSI